MAKGYWIAALDIEDGESFARYGPLSTRAVEAYGGRFLVRGGRSEQKEGSGRARYAVVEFDSYDTALACLRSADYQAAAKVRHASAASDVVIVEGVA